MGHSATPCAAVQQANLFQDLHRSRVVRHQGVERGAGERGAGAGGTWVHACMEWGQVGEHVGTCM